MSDDVALREARAWIDDCWGDDVPEGLSDEAVRRIVSKNYEGGWPAFLVDYSSLHWEERQREDLGLPPLNGQLVVYEFTEQVQVLGLDLMRVYRLAFSRRPVFSDAWYQPYSHGRARLLSIVKVGEIPWPPIAL